MATLLSLPFELVEAISSNLNQRDLGAFVRTNRRLYLSFNCHLYRYNKENSRGSALLWGARTGQIRTVQYSLQEGVNLEIEGKGGYTPLHMAVRNGNYAITKLLIENGTRITRDRWPSLLTMVLDAYGGRRSCIDIITHLSCWRDGLDSKALRAAARMGHEELVDLVAKKDQMDVYGPIWPLIVRAVTSCENNISIIRLLLEQGAEKESYRSSLLKHAQLLCCDATVKLLLERESFSYCKKYIHPLALRNAAKYGKMTMLNLFFESDAGPDDTGQYSDTPLMIAAHYGQFEVVKLLFEKGADVSRVSSCFSPRKLTRKSVLEIARADLPRWKRKQLSCWFNFRPEDSDKFRHPDDEQWVDYQGKADIVKYLLRKGVRK